MNIHRNETTWLKTSGVRQSEKATMCLALAVLWVALVALLLAAGPAARAQSGDGSGAAAFCAPASLRVGETGTLSLVFTATEGIRLNGGIRLVDPDFHGALLPLSRPRYLSVTWTNPGVSLRLSVQSSTASAPAFTTIKVVAGELQPGDVVTLVRSGLTPPVKAYQAVEWQTLSDANGDGTFAPIASQPRFDILPHPTPDAMVATGPTYVEAGVPFTLALRVLDVYGNPSVDFTDTLTCTSTDLLADLPPAASLFAPESGTGEFSLVLNTPGVQYVYVSGSGSLRANSNPFLVVDSLAAQPQLYWGDLHGHFGHVYTSTLGERVDEYLEYARDVSDLDFAAETPKTGIYINADRAHTEVEASVLQYDEPGRFVTLRGYEWAAAAILAGHHNVYFSGPTAGSALYDPKDPASDTLDELWTLLETNMPPGEEAVTVPHALCYSCPNCWQPCDDRPLEQRYRILAETFSLWGSSEQGCSGSAQSALAYGQRIGFYGSSDTHLAFPGSPQPEDLYFDDVAGGLAAVYADELSRDSLWQGLTQRRTYATDGDRILLDVRVNGCLMGSEITTTLAPNIVVSAAGTQPIAAVEIIKGTYVMDCVEPGVISDYYSVLYSATPNALTTSFEVTDAAFDANAFYYVRLTQVDGKRAWSSPVWVDFGSSVPNNPPVAYDVFVAGDEDSTIPWQPVVSDPDGHPLSCSIAAQPSQGSATVSPDCSAGTYTPGPDLHGDVAFGYQAYDGIDASAPATVYVTVNAVNDPPTAYGQSVTTPQDTLVGITLTGSDPDGDVLTYTLVTTPTYGSLSGLAPDLTYTPDPGFNGSDSFTFEVRDASDSSPTATVSITVLPPPPANQIQNGGFEADLSFWDLGLLSNAAAILSRDEVDAGEGIASARIEVTSPGTFLRTVQLNQGGLSLVSGQPYTLSFWARASVVRPIRILLRPSGVTWSYYCSLNQNITTSWQRYEFTCTIGVSDVHATLEFSLGQYASTVWLDGIELIASGP
jgi:hypothetical protein